MKYLGKKTDNKDIATQDDFGSYVTTNTAQTVSGAKTFSSPVVVNSNETYGLEVNSTSKGGYLKVQRGTGNNAVTMAIKSGSSGGTFGTVTNHQFQFRTNDTARMTVGTDGSVVLASDVASSSNNNQVATTKWVNSKIAPLSLYKQDLFAQTFTEDLYLEDGWLPEFESGLYYTGEYHIYINNTIVQGFDNAIIKIDTDGIDFIITRVVDNSEHYSNNFEILRAECYDSETWNIAYIHYLPTGHIRTSIPPSPSATFQNNYVPSFKLFYDQLQLKADSSSLGAVATSNDYDDLDNKPTIPNGALASLDSIDYTSNYITNKPTIPSSAADVGAMPESSVITAFWTGTQAQYEALSPDYSSTTLYLIHE